MMGDKPTLTVAVTCDFCAGRTVELYSCPHCGDAHRVIHLHYSNFQGDGFAQTLVRRACIGEPSMESLRAWIPLENWNEQHKVDWLLDQMGPSYCPHCGALMENREHDLFRVHHPDSGNCFLDTISFELETWLGMLDHHQTVSPAIGRIVPVAKLKDLLDTLNRAVDPNVSYNLRRDELSMARDALGYTLFQVDVAIEQVLDLIGGQ